MIIYPRLLPFFIAQANGRVMMPLFTGSLNLIGGAHAAQTRD